MLVMSSLGSPRVPNCAAGEAAVGMYYKVEFASSAESVEYNPNCRKAFSRVAAVGATVGHDGVSLIDGVGAPTNIS